MLNYIAASTRCLREARRRERLGGERGQRTRGPLERTNGREGMNDRLMEQMEYHLRTNGKTNTGNWRIKSSLGRTIIILHPTSKDLKTS